jgi:hypothetical protein
VRLALEFKVDMTGSSWKYSYYTEKDQLLRNHPVVYVRGVLVHISNGEPLLFTEVAVRTHLNIPFKSLQG